MRSVRAELLGSGWFGSVHASEFEAELTRRSARRLSESSDKVVSPRVKPLGSLGTTMPSVGMRRTTRVFGVVKGADGARVLRSGRRLWPESGETKIRRHHDGDDWFSVKKNGGGGGYEPNGWTDDVKPKKSPAVAEIEVPKKPKDIVAAPAKVHSPDKMYGIVYTRKRRRPAKSSDIQANSEALLGSSGRRFGRRFVRRQRRKLNSGESFAVADNSDAQLGFTPEEVISVVFVSSLDRNHYAARFLCSVLVYMTRARLRLTDLFTFLVSEPLSSVHTSSGITTFLDHPSTNRFASCKIFGAMQFLPLFCVDFSAIPLCFIYMHSCVFLKYKYQPPLVRNNAIDDCDEIISDEEEDQLSFYSGKSISVFGAMINPEANHTENGLVSHPSVKASKLTGRNTQYRNGLLSRGIQKRRSSLRRRAKNPSLIGVQKPNGALVSDLVSFRKNAVPLSVASNIKLRRSLRNRSVGHLKDVDSTIAELTKSKVGHLKDVNPTIAGLAKSKVGHLKDVNSTIAKLTESKDSTTCSANMLVIESEKCYREGVDIVLEVSSLGESFIAVKKDGLTKLTHKAEKVMRPCSCNRYTHAIMWTVDNGWKLEFPNRRDWLIFKDLYKQCSDRNVSVPGVKNIPIPGVNEVSHDGDNHRTPFYRPDSYISVKDDEVCRAMAKKTANYDLDSEDEEWLKKFNNKFPVENEIQEHVSEDIFELMFDTFEKSYYCSPFDIFEEKNLAADLCPHLGGRVVVEAVYDYWVKKRRQKKSSLLRVFQGHQVKRASLIPKPSFRKKRSFKRPASQFGRGKQPSLLHAMAAENDIAEEQAAKLRAEEAEVSVNKSVESAVQKRQRAQLLMDSADLATYKATMAIRIAEAALVSDSPDSAAAYLLD
ncbi:Enhancer of polycomb protein [Parasponia andersonii]|uniref:Enhancer of polycomb-like protein n=1 Tax=Parasponia andersonii TaxID=3476 RepID=A0A2P5BC94_PARAD|nr:Enhancer of polycomb protein [Parasponia andersonii]